jgi:hypothetical protein
VATVRHWPGVLPAIRRARRKRGERRAGQGAERRGITWAEPDDLLAEPADPVQRELERREPGEQPAQRREQRLADSRGRKERVQHRDMRRDPAPGGLDEPGTVAADGRLGGGHGQQQCGLPAGTGIGDQGWHAGEATLPARQTHPQFPGPARNPQAVPNASKSGEHGDGLAFFWLAGTSVNQMPGSGRITHEP